MILRRTVPLLILLPAMLAGCPGRNKDKDKTDTDTDQQLPTPDTKLVVAGMDPATGLPDSAFDAEVFGTDFQRGARVSFSGTPASRTDYTDDGTLGVRVPALPAGTYDVTVTNPDGESATLRRGLTLASSQPEGCPVVTVHFELDSVGLFPDDVAALQRAATCWSTRPGSVRVEGHCDERGTTEHNVALGQRRANAVVEYLSGVGLPRNRMRPVSYGEERPASSGHDESSWAQNRRAVIYLEE